MSAAAEQEAMSNKARLETLNDWVGVPLARLTPGGLDAFVDRLRLPDIEGFLRAWAALCIRPSDGEKPKLDNSIEGRACVVDSFTPITENFLSKSLLYCSRVLWGDPLLQHPSVLEVLTNGQAFAPPNMGPDAARDILRRALHFYHANHLALERDALLLTSWNAVHVGLMNVHNFLVGHENDLEKVRALAKPELIEFMREKALAVPFDSPANQILQGQITPGATKSIAIRFPGDPAGSPVAIQNHAEARIIDEAQRLVEMTPTSPDTPEKMHAWVEQSRLTVAANRLYNLQVDAEYADRISALFSTSSPVNFEALARSSPGSETSNPASLIPQLTIPSFEGVTLEDVLRAREDSEAFREFRLGFQEACSRFKASGPHDPKWSVQKSEIEDAFFKRGLARLEREQRGSLNKVLATGGIGSLGLCLGVLFGTPLGAGVAAILGGLTLAYQKWEGDQKLRSHPVYFLWKLQRK